MVGEELVLLAEAASSALIAAARTDAWREASVRFARLLGGGSNNRTGLELDRLGREAADLTAVSSDTARRRAAMVQHLWQSRLSLLLEGQDPVGRAHTATGLRAFLDDFGPETRVQGSAVDSAFRVAQGGGIVGGRRLIPPPPGAGQDEEQRAGGPVFAITGDVAIAQTSVYFSVGGGHTRPAWPHQIGVVPPRARGFRHTRTVAALWAVAGNPGTTVLVGAAGVGKTQTAADLATRVLQGAGLDLLVWISARSRDAVVAGYAQAAAEILGDQDRDAVRAARRFLAWLSDRPLEGPGRCRWMVVLDDVADPADLHGLWPPDHHHGRALVTTRRRDVSLHGGGNRVVPVELFTEEESVAYLTEQLAGDGRHEDAAELRALAAELDHLPLALSQAAAYLVDAQVDCAYYRRRLADRATSLADLTPHQGMLPDGQTSTLAAAWSLSVESADRVQPRGLARPMLRLLSLLDPNGVPGPVLAGTPTLAFLAAQSRPTRREDLGPPGSDEAVLTLRTLHRFSLIDHDQARPDQTVRVLETVQRTTRDSLTPDERDAAAVAAADALLAAWPSVVRDSALARTLRANVSTLTRHAMSSLLGSGHAHPVLVRAGESLGASGQVAAALGHFRALAEAADRFLGPDHPDTLVAMRRMAYWLGESGQFENALHVYRKVLERLRAVLGPDSPETLTARAELAWVQGHAGDEEGAVAATSDLLGDLLRVLGPDHPSTLTTRHNMAWWRGKAGDGAGAAATTAELLDDFVRVLGADHPATLTARHSLAQWRGEAGDAAGAAAAYEELLDLMGGVLGRDHPATLTARHDLAWWRGQAGDPAGAAAVYEQVLEDRLRALGPDHPGTLATRADLGWWRGQAGDSAGAVAVYEQVLVARTRVLGPEHPDTLSSRADLAYWQAMAGQTSERVAAPGGGGPGAPGCRVVLTLLDDDAPAVDRPIRIALRLHADPGHPWAVADDRRRPTLEVVATALGAATVEPARVLYDHVTDAEFILLARRAGRHVVRFTLYEHPSGTALQQVETELTVTGAAQNAEVLVPAPERRGRR